MPVDVGTLIIDTKTFVLRCDLFHVVEVGVIGKKTGVGVG